MDKCMSQSRIPAAIKISFVVQNNANNLFILSKLDIDLSFSRQTIPHMNSLKNEYSVKCFSIGFKLIKLITQDLAKDFKLLTISFVIYKCFLK